MKLNSSQTQFMAIIGKLYISQNSSKHCEKIKKLKHCKDVKSENSNIVRYNLFQNKYLDSQV